MQGQEFPPQQGAAVLYSHAVNLNEWIKNARLSANLTQAQLGDALHVTKSNVSGWENGRHSPSYEQMGAIARITGFRLPDGEAIEVPGFAPDAKQPQISIGAAVSHLAAAFANQDQAIRNAAADLLAEAVRRPDAADLLAQKIMKLSDEGGNG